jgi:hypothetical protein
MGSFHFMPPAFRPLIEALNAPRSAGTVNNRDTGWQRPKHKMDEDAKAFFASINANENGANWIFSAVSMIHAAYSHTRVEQKMRIAMGHCWFRIH